MRSHMNVFNNMNTQNATPPQPPPRRRANSMGQPRSTVHSNQAYSRRSLFNTTTTSVSFMLDFNFNFRGYNRIPERDKIVVIIEFIDSLVNISLHLNAMDK